MINNQKVALIIPARMQSTRLPGKVLKKINNKTILERVFNKCSKVFNKKNIFIATPDLEIINFETRVDGKEMVVTGMISNLSESAWKSVSVEAEFFDESGKFIGEGKDYTGSDIYANGKENFEVRFRYLPEAVVAGKATTKLKVAGGVPTR